MTDYVIPCATVARLAKIAGGIENPWFDTIRIDNGVAVATDRKIMAVECIGGPAGVVHLRTDRTDPLIDALIRQCETEAPLGGKLTIRVMEGLGIAGASTTFGYVHQGDPCLWSASLVSDFDRWRDIAARCMEPAIETNGGMYWCADVIASLAEASPSRAVVFEEIINVDRPALIRDIHDPNWFGVFNPWEKDATYTPATMPTWFRP